MAKIDLTVEIDFDADAENTVEQKDAAIIDYVRGQVASIDALYDTDINVTSAVCDSTVSGSTDVTPENE